MVRVSRLSADGRGALAVRSNQSQVEYDSRSNPKKVISPHTRSKVPHLLVISSAFWGLASGQSQGVLESGVRTQVVHIQKSLAPVYYLLEPGEPGKLAMLARLARFARDTTYVDRPRQGTNSRLLSYV